MPEKLEITAFPNQISWNTLYWGDQRFVDALIDKVNTNRGTYLGKGTFGAGYSVLGDDGIKYLVKKTHIL